MSSSLQCERGPYTVWRQHYVSIDENLGFEVDLMVRDFFESDEVEVEDVTLLVCYGRESRPSGEVGVYNVGVVIRGFPLGVPKDQVQSWSPSVASLVHDLCFSEVFSVKLQGDFEAFAMVRDIFEDDPTAVYVQQFFRSSILKTVSSRMILEREPLYSCFRRTSPWVCAKSGGELDVNLRKRKVDDEGVSSSKKSRVSTTVSVVIIVGC